MATRRIRIDERERIESFLSNAQFKKNNDVIAALKMVYRTRLVSSEEEAYILAAIPINFHDLVSQWLSQNNNRLNHNDNKIKKSERSIKKDTSKSSSIKQDSQGFRYGEILNCRTSQFVVKKGCIKWQTLTMKSVRIEKIAKEILEYLDNEYQIRVDKNNSFYFYPATDFSKFLSDCKAEEIRRRCFPQMEKGTPLLDLEIRRATKDIENTIAKIYKITADQIVENQYYPGKMADSSWYYSYKLYGSLSLQEFYALFSFKVNINLETPFIKKYTDLIQRLCKEYHLHDTDQLLEFNRYLEEIVVNVKKFILSLRDEYISIYFKNALNSISGYISQRFDFEFNSNDCILEENRILVPEDKLVIKDEDKGSDYNVYKELMNRAEDINYNASRLIKVIKSKIQKAFNKLYNKLVCKGYLILELPLSPNNLKILFPRNERMTFSFSEKPEMRYYPVMRKYPEMHYYPDLRNYPYMLYYEEHENNIYIKGNDHNKFLIIGSVHNVPLVWLFMQALYNPNLLLGELLKPNNSMHELWLSFVEKYYHNYQRYFTLPYVHFMPVFKLDSNCHADDRAFRNLELSDPNYQYYMIYEDYTHFSDEWSSKSNFKSYLKVSDFSITIIPTDPVSTRHNVSFSPEYKNEALYFVIRYFTSTFYNKRQQFKEFASYLRSFLG